MAGSICKALFEAGFPTQGPPREQALRLEASMALGFPPRGLLGAGLTEDINRGLVRITGSAAPAHRDRGESLEASKHAEESLRLRLIAGGVYRPERPFWLPIAEREGRRQRPLVGLVAVTMGPAHPEGRPSEGP